MAWSSIESSRALKEKLIVDLECGPAQSSLFQLSVCVVSGVHLYSENVRILLCLMGGIWSVIFSYHLILREFITNFFTSGVPVLYKQ